MPANAAFGYARSQFKSTHRLMTMRIPAMRDFGVTFACAKKFTNGTGSNYFTGGSVMGSRAWDCGQGALYFAMISPVLRSQCSFPNAL